MPKFNVEVKLYATIEIDEEKLKYYREYEEDIEFDSLKEFAAHLVDMDPLEYIEVQDYESRLL